VILSLCASPPLSVRRDAFILAGSRSKLILLLGLERVISRVLNKTKNDEAKFFIVVHRIMTLCI
jgi:hypothetical protein